MARAELCLGGGGRLGGHSEVGAEAQEVADGQTGTVCGRRPIGVQGTWEGLPCWPCPAPPCDHGPSAPM